MKHLAYLLAIPLSAILVSGAIGVGKPTETVLIQTKPGSGIAYTNPSWSPNGRSIAYVSVPFTDSPTEPTVGKAGKNVHVATMVGETWTHRLVSRNADWPVWSPNGRQLAFHQDGLVVMDVVTGKIRRLTSDKGKETEHQPGQQIHYPVAWSRDSRYILYDIAEFEGLKGAVYDTRAKKSLNLSLGRDGVWTRTGMLITTTIGGPPETGSPSNIKIVDPATGKTRLLCASHGASGLASPASAAYTWAWVTVSPPKGEGIYRLDLKSGALAKQVAVRAEQFYWSQDCKQFAFLGRLVEHAGEAPQYCIYMGNTKTWGFKALARGAAVPSGNWHDRMKYISWSPSGSCVAYVTGAGDIRILQP